MIKKIEDLNYYELLEVSPRATSQEIHKAYERVRRVYEPNSMALYSLFSPEETAAITQRIEEAYRTLVYESNRKRYDALLRGQDELPDLPPLPSDPADQPRQDQLSFPSELTYQPRPAQPALTLPSENRYLSTLEPLVQQPAPPKTVHETITPVSQFIADFTGPAIKMLREQHGLTVRNIADITKIGTRYLEFIEEEVYGKLPARAYTRGFLMLYAKALGCDPERMAGDYLKRYDAATTPKTK
ncbi:MAG: helix-turn-helix domain-containing protein [Nitrospirae bacterium]|nr:helix-turn-helix domain-containing protein [Nitrospirota bacterium]